MVRVTDELALSPDHVTLYNAADPLLGHLPILIFHGPSTTANYTLNSSRVQVHVLTPAGFQCFPRITISPNSPFYSVVNHLPREFQGDEVYRALAFGLFKYFTELPDGVKTYLRRLYPTRNRRPSSAPALFSEQHAADIVKEMLPNDHTSEVIEVLQEALQTQHVSNVDIDLVLPPGSIIPLQPADLEEVPDDEDDILDPTLRQYGPYTPLVKLFGDPVFLPTSRLRRAPSKPSALNRSKSFTKDQKTELRMKLMELVNTEERYVAKVRELVTKVAADFRESARARPAGSLSPSEEELERLFPQSADAILTMNSGFMEELRRIMDETEEDATKDMDMTTMNLLGSKVGRIKDPSGALAMARLFLEWFPKFTECYQDYIKASQHFPMLLNSFLDHQSSFKQRVAQTGEQTIRSILIEPVQRLPRYSLLIDQIVGCIPITHPALQPMLKARDIITNICSMDDPLPDKPHVVSRLRNMVESWPLDLEPQGRLITAADFTEVAPPFQASVNQSDKSGVFLLFSDCVIILKKLSGNMTGRDLLREIEKPSAAGLLISMTNAAGGPASYEYVFTGWHSLADVRFTEALDGSLFWMTSTEEMRGAHPGEHRVSQSVTSRCFFLQETFESRAAKWGEDVVKARVEARFSETEREDPTWTLRSVRMPDSNIGLHAAVFQEGADQLIEGRKEPAPVRIVVDHEKGTKGAPVGHYGVEIIVNLTTSTKDANRVSLITVGLNGKQYQDDVAIEDVLPTMSRRVIQLQSTQHNVSNPELTASLVSYYSKTLHSLPLTGRAEKTRSFLGTSPVKIFSSLWTGGSAHPSEPSPAEPKHRKIPSLHRNNSQQSVVGSLRSRDNVNHDEGRPENPLVRLEQTFTGYVAAFQSRKGHIVSRTLMNRSNADELTVNDFYNRLIESPFDYDASTDLSTEVIFMAFEKFLRIAWTEQIGPVMSMQSLNTLQDRVSKRVPGDFADFVNFLFGDMAPQNRRAFTALIKLLADLLDGCGNDGDRGALTLAFAELLVHDGSAPNYINLLDRLVEDCDRIFEEPGLNHSFNLDSTTYESINSAIRGGKPYTGGSVTSNTSSLRRKFGFDTLLRQNSKDDRSSMWRTLSKHRNPATGEPSSFSKASLGRSRSIDDNALPKKLQRHGGSRDRPPIAGAFDDVRPGSSNRMLETIGEPEPEPSGKSKRRKRRSSLSDLRTLMTAASLEDEEPPLQPLQDTSEKVNSSPGAPISPKTPAPLSPTPLSPKIPTPSRIPLSPVVLSMRASRIVQKENLAEAFQYRPETSDPPTKPEKGESPTKGHRHSRTLSTTNIPTLRPARPTTSGADSPTRRQSVNPSRIGSPTRPSLGNSIKAGSPTRVGTQKLRLQSPQKLRERLQTEKQAVESVDANLQSELSKIGEEMARVNSSRPPGAHSVDMRRLGAAIRQLEDRIPTEIKDVQDRHEALQRDMETTVKSSEAKVRAIDQLYKEAVAENELLYEKFNGELGKIVKALKGKGKEDKEDLMAKLRDQSEETARMKKENARLKREMVSLRAVLKSATE